MCARSLLTLCVLGLATPSECENYIQRDNPKFETFVPIERDDYFRNLKKRKSPVL